MQDVDSQVCRVEELQNVDQSVGVQRFVDQKVSDLMMFNQVAHDQSVEDTEADIKLEGTCGVAYPEIVVVLDDVGTEDSMQHFLDGMCVLMIKWSVAIASVSISSSTDSFINSNQIASIMSLQRQHQQQRNYARHQP